MGCLFLLLLPLGARPSWPMLLLPVAIAPVHGFHAWDSSLIVATANTFYRDCGHLVAVFFQAWYFATPILYPAARFSGDDRNGDFGSIRPTTSSSCFTTSFITARGRYSARGCSPRQSRRRAWESAMPYSSRKKTKWYSDSEPPGAAGVHRSGQAAAVGRAARCLAAVRQLHRQAVLAEARRASTSCCAAKRPRRPPSSGRCGIST